MGDPVVIPADKADRRVLVGPDRTPIPVNVDEWVASQLDRGEPVIVEKRGGAFSGKARTLYGLFQSSIWWDGVSCRVLDLSVSIDDPETVTVFPCLGDRIWPVRGCVMGDNRD